MDWRCRDRKLEENLQASRPRAPSHHSASRHAPPLYTEARQKKMHRDLTKGIDGAEYHLGLTCTYKFGAETRATIWECGRRRTKPPGVEGSSLHEEDSTTETGSGRALARAAQAVPRRTPLTGGAWTREARAGNARYNPRAVDGAESLARSRAARPNARGNVPVTWGATRSGGARGGMREERADRRRRRDLGVANRRESGSPRRTRMRTPRFTKVRAVDGLHLRSATGAPPRATGKGGDVRAPVLARAPGGTGTTRPEKRSSPWAKNTHRTVERPGASGAFFVASPPVRRQGRPAADPGRSANPPGAASRLTDQASPAYPRLAR